MRRSSIQPAFVEVIPDNLKDGTLYISLEHSTAIHLCCCGCGREVVTPIGKANWMLYRAESVVTLSPSIGNWNLPCRSHYFIRRNQIHWVGALNASQIREVQQKDLADAKAAAASRNRQRSVSTQHNPRPSSANSGLLSMLWKWVKSIFHG